MTSGPDKKRNLPVYPEIYRIVTNRQGVEMKTSEIEQTLFLRGWIVPKGLLGQNSVFELPERDHASLLSRKDVFYPVSSILHGGTVNRRVLISSELENAATVEIQHRGERGWVTDTLQTPEKFSFSLASDPAIPGLEAEEVVCFMAFAHKNGFTTCLPHETALGKMTLQSDTVANDAVCIQLDAVAGQPMIRVLKCAGTEFVRGSLQSRVVNCSVPQEVRLEEMTPEMSVKLQDYVATARQEAGGGNGFLSKMRNCWDIP